MTRGGRTARIAPRRPIARGAADGQTPPHVWTAVRPLGQSRPMPDLQFAPAHEIADAVRRRALSPVEVMRATLDRLDRLNPPLNAFVALRADAALDDARALEARVARGEDPGILAGVPFAVKDEEDLGGFPTTHGSAPWRNAVVAHDSTQVARARAAGAIPIGKTNLPEFGSTAFTKNHVFGTTRN